MKSSSQFVSLALVASFGAGLTGAFIGRYIGAPAAINPPAVSVSAPALAQELAQGASMPVAEAISDEDFVETDEPTDVEEIADGWNDYVVAKSAPEPARTAPAQQPERGPQASEPVAVTRQPAPASQATHSTRSNGTTQSEASEPVEYAPEPPARRRTVEQASGGVDYEPSAPPRSDDNARRDEPATLSRSDRGSAPSYRDPSARSAATTPYKKPSFWKRHRDPLTVAAGVGGGALLGAILGGKKGALIGGAAGGGGSALYTYKMRSRNNNRPYRQQLPPVRRPLFN